MSTKEDTKTALTNDELKNSLIKDFEQSSNVKAEKIERDFPTELIDLPTQGFFYPKNHPLSSGKIELKYMTAMEEDILTSANLIRQNVVIDRLLEALIVTPVDYGSILVPDKNQIMIAARILAYGKDYVCKPECAHCGESTQTTVDLTAIKDKVIDLTDKTVYTQGSVEIPYTVPRTGDKLVLRFLSHENEREIDDEIASMKKANLVAKNVDPEVSTRMKYVIIEVNGNRDTKTVRAYASRLLSIDSLPLRTFLKSVTPGVDMTFDFYCGNDDCTHYKVAQNRTIPITVDFFWPGAGL